MQGNSAWACSVTEGTGYETLDTKQLSAFYTAEQFFPIFFIFVFFTALAITLALLSETININAVFPGRKEDSIRDLNCLAGIFH